jgi:hypothetical protein
MKAFITAVALSVSFLNPSLAQDVPSFEEIVVGATAMTTLAGGYLLISKPDSAFLCVIDIREGYFVTLMQGGEPDASIPSAFCSSVEGFRKMEIQ